MNARIKDMRGERYGCVVAIRNTGERAKSRDLIWEFQCDCGHVFTANGYAFRSGKRSMCPRCAAKKVARASIKQSTIYMRINAYGWPIEKALTKGVTS